MLNQLKISDHEPLLHFLNHIKILHKLNTCNIYSQIYGIFPQNLAQVMPFLVCHDVAKKNFNTQKYKILIHAPTHTPYTCTIKSDPIIRNLNIMYSENLQTGINTPHFDNLKLINKKTKQYNTRASWNYQMTNIS